ncbi:hypothetical protein L1987_01534 [Smallanthus sonchifolius]|uniref:Uncharacterized protein n=1 Tax=Smallanthus sonchifolius TaxID=185202 RepID=A0ACB9K5B8_9ASTR|nr:hypothetical protein L1987_01534 [Smallanthus sonchifolius]
MEVEVRGWRKTGRPKQGNPSFTELKTVRCIIHDHQLEDIYKITEMSKSSTDVKPLEITSTLDEITIEESVPYSDDILMEKISGGSLLEKKEVRRVAATKK